MPYPPIQSLSDLQGVGASKYEQEVEGYNLADKKKGY